MAARVLRRGGEAGGLSGAAQARTRMAGRAAGAGRYRLAFGSLAALTLALPFELTQRPLLQTPALTVTDVKLFEYLAAILALMSLVRARRVGAVVVGRLPIALFLALVTWSLLSSLVAPARTAGLKWTVDLAIGGMLWAVVPQWLSVDREARLHVLRSALLAGAVAAACVGLLECVLGMGFAESLGWFKPKPTVAGPFLRLSGTFEYANIAALYFELAFPFALGAFFGSLWPSRGGLPRLLLWLAALAVLFEAILLTYSRGALLGLGLCLATMAVAGKPWLRWPGLPRRRMMAVVAAIVIGLSLVARTFSTQSIAALRLSSQSDQDWYRAAFVSSPPASLSVCRVVRVPVTVQNRSPLTWVARGSLSYHLGYHWLASPTRVAVFEGLRTALPGDLGPGQSMRVLATLRAPAAQGSYLLVWDMVQENVSWFSLKSAAYARIPVRVTGVPAAQRAHACATGPTPAATGRPEPATLPVVLSEPNRRQLWRAALAMIRSRPLFGIGPDGFRLNYGRFAVPKLAAWDQRILANSLYLEIGADLGLVGSLLCLAFLLAIYWPLILRLVAAQPLDLWQVAVLGALAAFLGHGAVDYNLESHAIFILFWVLCGIATTVSFPSLPNVVEG